MPGDKMKMEAQEKATIEKARKRQEEQMEQKDKGKRRDI